MKQGMKKLKLCDEIKTLEKLQSLQFFFQAYIP
jgi:hypothetical protein